MRNTLFVIIRPCGLEFYGKGVAWGHRGLLTLSCGGKGKRHKHQEKLLWDVIKNLPKELTTELLYLVLPLISVSCGVKGYMHYIRFLLTKTS